MDWSTRMFGLSDLFLSAGGIGGGIIMASHRPISHWVT